ncbi:MAG: universal stress protein [Pseudomonadota bacterium]
MFSSIMVPVDLAHVESLQKALATAADLAHHYNASVTYLGVASALPTSLTQNAGDYQRMLDAFVAQEAAHRNVNARAHMVLSHDPAAELNNAILRAIRDSGADLVVMASHVPGIIDHIFSSHGGWIASHAPVTVMVVR